MNWYCVRIPTKEVYNGRLELLYSIVEEGYQAAGRGAEFRVLRSHKRDTLCTYLSPAASERLRKPLSRAGFALVPLGPDFERNEPWLGMRTPARTTTRTAPRPSTTRSTTLRPSDRTTA